MPFARTRSLAGGLSLRPVLFLLAILATMASAGGLSIGATEAPVVPAQPAAAALDSAEAAKSLPAIRYWISLRNPGGERFGVTIEWRGMQEWMAANPEAAVPTEDGQGRQIRLGMPNWTPGLYRRFASSNLVEDMGGYTWAGAEGDEDGERVVMVTPDGEGAWRLTVPADTDGLNISYRTSATAPFIGGSLRSQRADVHGTTLFCYLRGRTQEPASVTILDLPTGWRTYTAMPELAIANSYVARDYDQLVDCPFMFGTFDRTGFTAAGTKAEVIVSAPDDLADEARAWLVEPLQGLLQAGHDLFGELPFDNYKFLFRLSGGGAGGSGLEHRNSTMIWMPYSMASGSGRDRARALYVASHELFHVWNVKRIRATPIRPYNYDEVAELDCLWFHEGVTSYYTLILLARSGIEGYDAEWLRRELTQLLGGMNRSRNYYRYGAAYGFVLDMAIRRATDNARSLDDLMRGLDAEYGDATEGFDQTAELAERVEALCGEDLSWVMERHILNRQALPVAAMMQYVGLEWAARDESEERGYWGIRGGDAGGEEGVLLAEVHPVGPIGRAGIVAGEVLLSIDGEPVNGPADLQRLASDAPGDSRMFRFQRADGGVVGIEMLCGRRLAGPGVLMIPEGSAGADRFAGIVAGTTAE